MLAETQGQLDIKGRGVALITRRLTGGELSLRTAKMSHGALRLFLVLAVHSRCVVLLAIVQDRGMDPTKTAHQKLDAVFQLRNLPRGPAVAPHKKAPQFMLDLFNAVSVSDGTPKSQKEILDGNVVRSFEDKGEQ